MVNSIDDSQVLKEVRALATVVYGLAGLATDVKTNAKTTISLVAEVTGLSTEIRAMSTTVNSLDRQVGRMDQRLSDVEGHVIDMKQQTDLIPGISDAVGAFSEDINDHKKRLKRLEKAKT